MPLFRWLALVSKQKADRISGFEMVADIRVASLRPIFVFVYIYIYTYIYIIIT